MDLPIGVVRENAIFPGVVNDGIDDLSGADISLVLLCSIKDWEVILVLDIST